MRFFGGCFLLLGAAWLNTGVSAAAPLTFVAGTPQLVYTAQQRIALGLRYWPDGNLGVVASGSNYGFYAANSGQGSTPPAPWIAPEDRSGTSRSRIV